MRQLAAWGAAKTGCAAEWPGSEPSSDFQKICRDMSLLSDILEIKSVDNLLLLSCKGDFCTQETRLGQTNNGMTFKKNNSPKIKKLFA